MPKHNYVRWEDIDSFDSNTVYHVGYDDFNEGEMYLKFLGTSEDRRLLCQESHSPDGPWETHDYYYEYAGCASRGSGAERLFIISQVPQVEKSKPNVLGHIIVATRDDGSRHYMALDHGYSYFTQHFGSAAVLDTLQNAQERITSVDQTFAHSASGACNEKPHRSVTISVEELTSNAVWERSLTFNLTRP